MPGNLEEEVNNKLSDQSQGYHKEGTEQHEFPLPDQDVRRLQMAP